MSEVAAPPQHEIIPKQPASLVYEKPTMTNPPEQIKCNNYLRW